MTSKCTVSRRKAVNLTGRDRAALQLIALCGRVMIGADGEPALESNRQVTRGRVERLIELGHLQPNGDAMFGCRSQTYSVKQDADTVADDGTGQHNPR